MSATITPPLGAPGPLIWMAEGIRQRLQVGFPPTLFDFAFMPAKADKLWFKQASRRTAMVALGFVGVTPEGEGGVFAGRAKWTVALFTKNPKIEARYIGDALSPGVFAMVRVATLLLNGHLIDPPELPWCATGTTIVEQIGNLYNDEWGDENTAVAALDISILYEETLPAGIEEDPALSLSLAQTWNFGEQQPLFADNIGGA